MRLTNIIYLLVPFIAKGQLTEPFTKDKQLFVCYGHIVPATVKDYGLVVLETQHYNSTEISEFKKYNDKVIAYISLTEVNKSSFIYEALKPYLLEKNEHWGSNYIDIAHENVQNIILNAVNSLMDKGVDGLFFDNLDNVSEWGKLSDKKAPLIQLIKKIRLRYPKAFLMQNAGLSMAEELKTATDAILMESVFTAYTFEEEKYALRDVETTAVLLKKIKKIRRAVKKPIYLLEYADDLKMKRTVERSLKGLDYPFFIANIDLQTIPKFHDN